MLTANELEAGKQFWNWFEKNHLPFEFLTGMEQEQIEDFSNQLQAAIDPYCPELWAHAANGMYHQDGFSLVISASGKIPFFDKAKELVALAPEIPRWNFYALSPPLPRHIQIRHVWEGQYFDPNDIWFWMMDSPDSPGFLGIHLALKLYDEADSEERKKELRQMLIQLVVSVIGEESWAMNIQHLQLGALPPAPMEVGMMPMYDLPECIEEFRKEHSSPWLKTL